MLRPLLDRVAAWWTARRQARLDALHHERGVVVGFDEETVSVTFPSMAPERTGWNELVRVAIETNDAGPWMTDVWWLLEGETRRVAYPLGATGEQALLARLQATLPAFDNGAVALAMGSTSVARFVCWQRSGSVASADPTID